MTKFFTVILLFTNISCATVYSRSTGDKEQVLIDLLQTCRKDTLIQPVRSIECYMETAKILPQKQFPDVYSNLRYCLVDKEQGRSPESSVLCMDSRMKTMISVERNIN